MNSVYELVIERNNRETAPFLSVHEANATLLIQVDALLTKYELSEREVSSLRQQLQDAAITSPGTKVTSAAAKAARKYEVQLRDKLEKLQDEYNAKLKSEANDQAAALKTAKDLSDMKDLSTAQEMTIANLREENKGAERAIEHLTNELSEAKSRTDLAEKQYDGLKKTIRSLQIENDHLKKESRIIEQRVVTEKGKTVDEVNILTEMVNSLKREVDMLRAYNKGSWFSKKVSKEKADNEDKQIVAKGQDSGRKWGTLGTVLPSAPKQTIDAHTMDGTCVKYDASGTNLVATSSSDSTVKIWDTNSGTVRVTFRGTVGHSMMCCDINGSTVVGGSSDKTCRVWNLRTQRMIHHLVGHAHKVTCVRLFANEHAVVTGSADRSLKVWDISHKTYRQTTTLRHSSTSNCVDVGTDSQTAVSGHLDGGLRFWDLRSGERTEDISGLHEGAITSCQFSPTDSSLVLTNGADSCLKITDLRTGLPTHTLRDGAFTTAHSWSHAVFSPDGRYVTAGSSSQGAVLVWSATDGSLVKTLRSHVAGVCAIDWCRGGSSGQQVASLDRQGKLILWA
jgi:autophagy-related protein 16